ncbi:MAG: succinylglutamate desuccinylase/aspartoacylase family protein [Oscillospiraceae bacterium]|nr:succinylglutamate desuccinylase/aspartoacylase family protein [Oscillospiraceae bacterium]
MTTVIASAGLAVNERIEIRRNRITGEGENNGKRVCIVTGTHGDELEGQYVCAEIARVLSENLSKLCGVVDIYPALNPLGVDSITRGIPLFDLDMNRIFPGTADGTMAECLAADIIKDISGADICIDIHSSNIYLKEIPQIRINELSAEELLPYAKMLGCDFIWIHSSATVLESTLAYSLNTTGTKTLVVEMGVGMRITREYCRQLTAGIFNLLKNLGMWSGATEPVRDPIVSGERAVEFVNSGADGIFVPCVEHWVDIEKGEHIGDVLDPATGRLEEYVTAPCSGRIFTLREFPIVYGGSLIARILVGGEDNA